MSPAWLAYESVAQAVLQDIRRHLGIATVEGKQTLAGTSGTSWEVDARAWREHNEGFLVVEVRRYVTSSLKQEDIAALAYRIADVRAAGGVVVSPLPLQRGAALLAKAEDIARASIT
jgi:hypothetical protein